MYRDLRAAKYPIDYGSYQELSALGRKLADLTVENTGMRHLLDPKNDDAGWRTFRDVDPSPFVSIFTGQGSCALPKRWLELGPDDDVVGGKQR